MSDLILDGSDIQELVFLHLGDSLKLKTKNGKIYFMSNQNVKSLCSNFIFAVSGEQAVPLMTKLYGDENEKLSEF